MAVERGARSLLSEHPDEQKISHSSEDSVTMTPTKARERIDKKSVTYMVRSGIAGGIAACAAKTIVGPLDRVKILYQTSNPQFAKYTGSWFGVFRAMGDINKSEGMRGLFRGHSATLLRIFPYGGIKFLAYEQFRSRIIQSQAQETHLRRLLSGSLAGVTSVFFTYPLEVIRVRLAFETKKDSRSSLSRICNQIYHEHPKVAPPTGAATAVIEPAIPRSGLVNFYRGFTPTLLGMVPYAGMSFLTHDGVGDLLRHPSIAPYTVIQSTLASGQTASSKARRSQLTAPAELTAGAIAGLVSQTASYPMEVIRRRMQVGGAVGDRHRLGMAEVAKTVWKERGWRGFFVGLTIGYLKVVPMAATSFFVYERAKWWMGIET